jgi:pyruvate-formate lyase-activating enzyme
VHGAPLNCPYPQGAEYASDIAEAALNETIDKVIEKKERGRGMTVSL